MSFGNVVSTTGQLSCKFYLIWINLYLSHHMWLVDAILNSTDARDVTLQTFKHVFCLQLWGAPPFVEPSVTSSLKVNLLLKSNFCLGSSPSRHSCQRQSQGKIALIRSFFFFSLSFNLYVTHLRSSSLQFGPFVVAGSLTFYNPLRVRLAERKKLVTFLLVLFFYLKNLLPHCIIISWIQCWLQEFFLWSIAGGLSTAGKGA